MLSEFITTVLALVFLLNALLITPARAADAGTVTLTVNQIFTNNNSSASPNAIFTYQLTPDTVSAPMPAGGGAEGYTFTVTGTGQVQVGPVNFTKPGAYSYQIKCETRPGQGYMIDTQVYSIEIHITNDLEPMVIVYLSNGYKTSKISFRQTYREPLNGLGVIKYPPVFVPPVTAPPTDSPGGTIEPPTATPPTDSPNGTVEPPETTPPTDSPYGTVEPPVATPPTDNSNETVEPPATAARPGSQGDGPNTGDDSDPALWATLLVIDILLLLFIVWLWRRAKR